MDGVCARRERHLLHMQGAPRSPLSSSGFIHRPGPFYEVSRNLLHCFFSSSRELGSKVLSTALRVRGCSFRAFRGRLLPSSGSGRRGVRPTRRTGGRGDARERRGRPPARPTGAVARDARMAGPSRTVEACQRGQPDRGPRPPSVVAEPGVARVRGRAPFRPTGRALIGPLLSAATVTVTVANFRHGFRRRQSKSSGAAGRCEAAQDLSPLTHAPTIC
jgi:hypothetical protein